MADRYEEAFMQGSGAVLYRDKTVLPRWAQGLMSALTVLPLAVTGAVVAGGAEPGVLLAGLAGSTVAGMAGVLFAVLRVTVSERELHIQYGPFGPRIPIDEVASVEVVEYSLLKYGGFGIRLGIDGSMIYNMLGDGRRAVRLKLTKGRPARTILVASREPEALASAIEEAKRRLAGAGPRVRVEGDERVAIDEHEIEAEREAPKSPRLRT